MNFVLDLLVFLGVLSVLVLVHELGHFLAARRAGIRVDEFGFGFPPRVFGRKIGETIYSVNVFPIGGFVRLHGEDDEVNEERERAFFFKGKLTRISVIVAGVVMNVLLAVVAFSVVSWVVGVPRETGQVKIIGITPNSPAEQAGIKVDEVVEAVDGERIGNTSEFVNLVNQKRGQEVNIVLLSAKGEEKGRIVTAVPRINPPQGEGALGVAVSSSESVHPPLWQRPFVSLWMGSTEAIFWVKTTIIGVAQMVGSFVQGRAPEGIAGPIGIFKITSHAARTGVLSLVSFVGILSINLAILNILPFPALDGGRLLFVIVEALFGRRVLPTFERYAHAAGMVILIILILLITMQDVARLRNDGFDFLQNPQ